MGWGWTRLCQRGCWGRPPLLFITSLTNSVFHCLFCLIPFLPLKNDVFFDSALPLCVLPVNFRKLEICLTLLLSFYAKGDSWGAPYLTCGSQGAWWGHDSKLQSWATPCPSESREPAFTECLALRECNSESSRQALTRTNSQKGWKSGKRNILMATGWVIILPNGQMRKHQRGWVTSRGPRGCRRNQELNLFSP